MACSDDYKINERNEPLSTDDAIKASEIQADREGL